MKTEFAALSLVGLFALFMAGAFTAVAVLYGSAGVRCFDVAIGAGLLLLLVRSDAREPIANGTWRQGWLMRRRDRAITVDPKEPS